MRVPVTIAGLVVGILLSANVSRDGSSPESEAPPLPPLAAARMTIRSAPLQLSIEGTSAFLEKRPPDFTKAR